MVKPKRFDTGDGLLLAGAGCIVGGVWWIYPPIALILAGAVMLLAGIMVGD